MPVDRASPTPRRALALLAARLAGDPAEKLVLAGVTGTNGKTTTTTLLEAILARRYGAAGFLGTVGYRTARREHRGRPHDAGGAAHPGAARRDGRATACRAAAMEVSSHALALDRVEGCRFDVAVFTNLTRDHLDFHGDMETTSRPRSGSSSCASPARAAVVNADDPFGRGSLRGGRAAAS